MAKIEVELSDRVQNDIEQMVAQGEFVNWDEAVESLLSRGVAAYDVEEESRADLDEDLFTQSVEDQQDPAMRDDPDDEYTL
ncbi:MAG: CopG family transcriptional regulator [Halorientalis sp.]